MTPRLALSPTALRARPLVVAGGFWVMTTSFLTLIIALLGVAEGMLLRSYWLLLPSSLTLMLPFAILPAIDAMRRDGQEPTHLEFIFFSPGFGPTLALALLTLIARTGIWLRQRVA